jgi:hypothetical protein
MLISKINLKKYIILICFQLKNSLKNTLLHLLFEVITKQILLFYHTRDPIKMSTLVKLVVSLNKYLFNLTRFHNLCYIIILYYCSFIKL